MHFFVAAKSAAPGGPLVVSQVLKHSITIAWQPPPSDGGSPVKAYIIEKRDALSSTSWSRIDRVRGHVYTYTATNLVPGHKYLLRVTAENTVGRSARLEMRTAVEPCSPNSTYQLDYLCICGIVCLNGAGISISTVVCNLIAWVYVRYLVSE